MFQTLDSLREWLRDRGRVDLLQMVGELTIGERPPFRCRRRTWRWHLRRDLAGESQTIDTRRLSQMFNDRFMTVTGMTNEEIATVAARTAAEASRVHSEKGKEG